jgi:hypothetical protein
MCCGELLAGPLSRQQLPQGPMCLDKTIPSSSTRLPSLQLVTHVRMLHSVESSYLTSARKRPNIS